MRSSSSASVRLSSPPVCLHALRPGLVDAAVEHLMVRKDFQAAFDICEKGLESFINSDDHEETWWVSCMQPRGCAQLASSRHGELKAALCIVGIQALAELNQWRDVLTWVVQHYGKTEKIPAKIIQMCVLLYTKVSEQAEVQEVVRTWLHCSSNMCQSGYSSVAELYILHVLLPLGQTTEAIDLLEDEVGQVAFTEDQRQTAIAIVENHDSKRKPPFYPCPESVCMEPATRDRVITSQALPSAFPWILRLYGLFQQMWNTMFGPYYRAFS